MHLFIATDGGARGNPGPSGIGAVLTDAEGERVGHVAECIGIATNNQAEYRAFIAGLEAALRLGATQVTVQSDSELLVKQILGEYRVKNEKIQPLYKAASTLLDKFEKYTVKHVRREANAEADALVNAALDAAEK
jgi:ribonuclease HI